MKKQTKPITVENILNQHVPLVLTDCFNRYAKAVITDRAIPDVRDGLKPVQRRIIYAMYTEGNTYNKPTRKCARTVGVILGKFHPHGDSSAYDAMVHLSQDWKMRAPLLVFQGNNGSIDNDPAAAYRYTEAKLSKISDLMVADLEKDTVDMSLNFDDSELEPDVLPARFPNLLVNGTTGIAVGAATNIPTHNLKEVCEAVIYRIEHKRATVADLLNYIKGPDFPTGGVIDDVEALKQIYETGQGSFYVHCDVHIYEATNQIIITDIPYGTIKSKFVADLDKRRVDDKLDNILEVRDESTEDVRIVLDIKKDSNPQAALNYLRQKGSLRSTFAVNMLALDKGHPKTMNLLEIIDAYIDHQVEVITRRSKFDIQKKTARLSIVRGLMKAISVLDKVIEIIRHSSGKEDSKNKLIEAFDFTKDQAEAIVTMQLYRLSNTDVTALQKEEEQLEGEIKELNEILANEDKLNRVIIKDLKEVIKEFGNERKTTILDSKIKIENIDAKELIAKEDCYVVLTKDGYVKRTNLRSYQASVNGNPIDDLPKIKVGDRLVLSRLATTHDSIVAFTSKGGYFVIPVHMISEGKWKEEGKHLNTLITLPADEKVIQAFVVSTFEPKVYFALLTKEGKIKRTLAKEFEQSKLTPRPLRAIGLTGADELVSVALTSGNSDIVIVNTNGQASRFNENEVPVVGIKAGGVKAMNQGKEIYDMSCMFALNSDEHVKLLLLADKRCARIIQSTSIETSKRLGSKVSLVKIFKNNPMNIVSVSKVYKKKDTNNFVAIATDSGSEIVNINDLETTLLGSGLRENLDIGSSKSVLGVHFDGEYLNDKTKVEEAPKIVEIVKAEDNSGEKQLSLFDLFDEE